MPSNIDQSIISTYKIVKNELSNIIDNKIFYEEFVLESKPIKCDEKNIYIFVKNNFAKTVLNNDYSQKIKRMINEKLNTNYDVHFVSENDQIISKINNGLNTKISNYQNKFNINENYTFSNFVIRNFNRDAANAVKSILSNKKYNPICIYGGIGLGKTHLLHAIGNEYAKLNKKVKYISSDEFAREIYNSLTNGGQEIEKLKNEFHEYDLLLIDDIQFLAKKEKINEIFFNIFNHNVSNNKVIIMTSDKNPEYLDGLEERMRSRFLSGLFVKINYPDLDTMKIILDEKIKSISSKLFFSDDAINYIVNRNMNDIRKMEGYLNKIIFFFSNSQNDNEIITQSIIENIINEDNDEIIKNNGYDVNPNLVISKICEAYSVSPEIVKSKSRIKLVANARHVCMYVLRNKFNMSYSQIGSFFSGRDHSTVIESISKIEKITKLDNDLKDFIEKLYKKI